LWPAGAAGHPAGHGAAGALPAADECRTRGTPDWPATAGRVGGGADRPRVVERMRRMVGAAAGLAVLALLAAGCVGARSTGGSAADEPPATTAAATTPPARRLSVSHPTVWLCRPGQARNPCEGGLDATVVQPGGSRAVEPFRPAADPPVDCFYVYPTVSAARTSNAPLAPEPAVIEAARAQAARFAAACRLFVPIYRQVTVAGLLTGKITDLAARRLAHGDVVSAWHDYLLHDNQGRRFVLIGHSQGTLELTGLIQEEIDGDAQLRGRLLSALLIGGHVTVPPGQDVGGSFRHIPACRRPDQAGCVVAYNSFGTVPPADSLFGRPSGGQEVLCVNPAALAGSAAGTHPYLPTSVLGGSVTRLAGPAGARRGFVAFPGAITAGCRRQNGINWLQVDMRRDADLPATLLRPTLGPAWGLHRGDITLALGDLTALVASQARGAR
jgi:hypothetical protein